MSDTRFTGAWPDCPEGHGPLRPGEEHRWSCPECEYTFDEVL